MEPLDILLNQIRYEHRPRVREDVEALLQDVRSLQPLLGTLIGNDGSESRMVLLSGTIPIYFQAQQYNISIDLFLPENYPRVVPKLYVRPTANMMVHPNHPHVDKEGLVYLPYLSDWHQHAVAGTLSVNASIGAPKGRSGYNLVELMILAVSVFSEYPPLFTRPTKTISSPAATTPTPPTTTTKPAAVPLPPKSNRDILIEQITTRLQRELRDRYTSLRHDLDQEFRHQTELEKSREQVQQHIQSLVQTKNELVSAVADVARRRLELQAWGAKEERALQASAGGGALGNNGVDNSTGSGNVANNGSGVDGATNNTTATSSALDANGVNNSTTTTANATTNNNDDARLLSCFVPYDPASQQLVELHAELRAIDDAMFVLEKALRAVGTNTIVNNTNTTTNATVNASATGAVTNAGVVSSPLASASTAAASPVPGSSSAKAVAVPVVTPLTLPVFLKTTRQLAARQFLCQAHVKKIQTSIDVRSIADT